MHIANMNPSSGILTKDGGGGEKQAENMLLFSRFRSVSDRI